MDPQNMILTACYVVLAVVFAMRPRFPVMLVFCGVSAVYNITFDGTSRALNVQMMILRTLTVIECAYMALRKDGSKKWLIVGAVLLTGAEAVLVTGDMEATYYSVRTALAIESAVFLLVLSLADWRSQFCGKMERIHLRLLTGWMILRAAQSGAYAYYSTEDAWLLARWIYVAVVAVIVAIYVFLFLGLGRRLAPLLRFLPLLLPRALPLREGEDRPSR